MKITYIQGPMEAAMKKLMMATLVGSMMMALVSIAVAGSVTSLRGDNALDADAVMFDKAKQEKAQGGFERAWELQPPTIPHGIEKDRISLRENTCMKCHSRENHEKEKAPAVGDSHFMTRDGEELKKVSTRRWFCSQCHVPQANLSPLVENTF